MRLTWAIACSALAAASSACNGTGNGSSSDAAAGGAAAWSAPSGLTLPHGRVFSLDTTTAEFVTPIDGTTAVLVSVLASPGGRRRIELRDGGRSAVIAPSAWVLPPHGAATPSAAVLACWNTLTGASAGDTMPLPALGMTLSCRLVQNMKPGAAVVLPTGTAKGNWLVAVRAQAGAFAVRHVRDAGGWLVGPPAAGDGVYDIAGDGVRFQQPVLVTGGSLVP